MITLRRPMKKLPLDIAPWQEGYRNRLMKQVEDSEHISNSEEFFKHFHEMSKTCPDCFCPNLESYHSEYTNRKGFWCPACGNSFSMPITKQEKYIWSVNKNATRR